MDENRRKCYEAIAEAYGILTAYMFELERQEMISALNARTILGNFLENYVKENANESP